jgi:tetratricopeptide (TPR) repeat protein
MSHDDAPAGPDGTGFPRDVTDTGQLPAWSPRDAAACAALGEQFARRGRSADAEKALRQALVLQPQHAAAAMLLARLLLAQNRAGDACSITQRCIDAAPRADSALHLFHAQILLVADRPQAAIDAFGQAIAAAPDSGAAELGLAVALGRSGRCEDAVTAAQRAIAKGCDNPGARHVLGRALFDCGRFAEAEAEFRRVLEMHATHAAAHANLADLVWMRRGDVAAATAELDAVLRRAPGLAELRILRSRLLDATGDAERSYADLAAGLRLDQGNADLHLAAAQTALKSDPLRALEHAVCALRIAPANTDALVAQADALLAAGRPESVVAITDRMLRADADDGRAIALRASAWRALGDPRYRELYDYARFVHAAPLDTPEGWIDLAAYLDDLALALQRRHSLRAHPVNQTVRHGSQVELRPEHAAEPAIRALAQAIDGPIRRYVGALGRGDDPLRRRNRGSWRLNGLWSVRLRSGGHHINHHHGRGWLSSACYVALPNAMAAHGGAGWLAFGESGVPVRPALPPEYFVRPEPGLLVLFPSWMWHGTVPFSGTPEDTRLSIAFDVVPVAPASPADFAGG